MNTVEEIPGKAVDGDGSDSVASEDWSWQIAGR